MNNVLKIFRQRIKAGFENKRVMYKPSVWIYSTVEMKDVAEDAATMVGLDIATTTAVAQCIESIIDAYVLNGHHVKFPYLGYMGFRIHAKMVGNVENVSASLVKRNMVFFRAAGGLRKAMLDTVLQYDASKTKMWDEMNPAS